MAIAADSYDAPSRSHLASIDGSPWPPPTPLHCDHCGLPVTIRQEARDYVHVIGWVSCHAANWPNWRGERHATAAVDGHWRTSTPRGRDDGPSTG